MTETTREQAIQWCKDKGCDFVTPVLPPPDGWIWDQDGEHLVLVAIFTTTEQVDNLTLSEVQRQTTTCAKSQVDPFGYPAVPEDRTIAPPSTKHRLTAAEKRNAELESLCRRIINSPETMLSTAHKEELYALVAPADAGGYGNDNPTE